MNDVSIWTLLTNNVFTVLLLGLAKILYDIWEKKQDRGKAKTERLMGEIEHKLETLEQDVESGKKTDVVLLHDRIWQAFRILSKKKKINYIDRANIEYLYEEYKAKGGNHKAEVMMEFIKTIPVETKGEIDDEQV